MLHYEMKERTIGKLLKAKASKNGSRIFLLFEEQEISYKDLDHATDVLAAGFSSLGIKKGDNVCLMLPNCSEFIYSLFALAKIGAVMVPINTSQKGDLLAYFINDSDASFMIIEKSFVERIITIREKVPNLSTLIIHSDHIDRSVTTPFHQHWLQELMENNNIGDFVHQSQPVYAFDPLCILYTSGSTGPSKGVVLPHNYSVYMAELMANSLEYTSEDTIYICLALFHGNAPLLGLMPALVADARLALARRFSASNFWSDIRRYGVTAFNALGGMITILNKQPISEDEADNKVRVCSGGPATVDVIEEFERRFGLKVVEGYGATECGVVAINTVRTRRAGSVGRAHDGYEIMIVDDYDQEVPNGSCGEAITRPRKPWTMMTEYYKMPDKTTEAFRNLWFHTGDYLYKDDAGFFYFVDRKKDSIRRKGENISSYEVEKIVNKHSSVLESAAVRVLTELGDEEVKIYIVLRPGHSLRPEELITYCDANMAFYMVPRYVEFRDNLPKTPSERIEKYKLKDEGLTESTWDRVSAGLRLSQERY